MAGWKENLKDSLKFAGESVADGAARLAEATRAAGAAAARPTHVCTRCGYQGKPIIQSGTNGCFAILLLCLFIIPGILYIVFTSGRQTKCPKCGAVKAMIPIDSPQARVILSQTTSSLPTARRERPCPFCAEPILVEARVCKHCGRDVA